MIGPSIPEHLLKKKENNEEPVEEKASSPASDLDDVDAFMPELPPDLLPSSSQAKRRTMGPSLPSPAAVVDSANDSRYHFYNNDDDHDDDVIGPVLPSQYDVEKAALSSTITAIEERARQSEKAMTEASSSEKKVERPEWMLAPPDVDYLKNANTGRSRTFNQRTVDAAKRDTSGWTDTPADKAKKQQQGERSSAGKSSTQRGMPSEQELETRRKVEQHNRTERPLSLLEMHRKDKTKKRKKEGEDDPTKRPFDREKDLMGTRKMSKKQKAELLEKSGEWSDRFSSTRGSSFL